MVFSGFLERFSDGREQCEKEKDEKEYLKVSI
jgi:hypothetical protein